MPAETIALPALDLHVARVPIPCRNWTGAPVFACVAHEGVVYTFTSDTGMCHMPPRQDQKVLDLLSRLTPR